ncbi:MAG: type 1 glutamine amidotransferase [Acidobacteriaceae bacterium]
MIQETKAEIVVLQHAECEALGTIERALQSKRLRIRYVRPFSDEPIPDEINDAKGLIVMGGPMGVYEQERYPYLRDELRLIERAAIANKPVLGVCLGSQLLAYALGGAISKRDRKEIGWYPVRLTDEAVIDSLWAGVPREFTAFHWHGDVFSLPLGATPLASSALTEQQAFRYGAKAYGLLFHLEVTRPHIDGMVETFRQELEEAGIDAEAIVQQTSEYLLSLQAVGTLVFEHWTRMLACD